MNRQILLLLLLTLSTTNIWGSPEPINSASDAIKDLIAAKAKSKESAFISGCTLQTRTGVAVARIVYFPRTNEGRFVLDASNGHTTNDAAVFLDNDGKWQMSDLNGGMQTILILNDVFYQLTRLEFTWSDPSGLKPAISLAPHNVCQLHDEVDTTPH